MFGSLKRRLKEAVDKVSNIIAKEEARPAEHVDEPVLQEIKKEAELIAEEEPFKSLDKEDIKAVKEEEMEKEVAGILEETQKKTALEAEEEAKLIVESGPFTEVIEEEMKQEKPRDITLKSEKLIEKLEKEDLQQERKLEKTEEALEEVRQDILQERAGLKADEIERMLGKEIRHTIPEKKHKAKKPATDLEKIVEEAKPAFVPEKEKKKLSLIGRFVEKTLTEGDIDTILKELEMALLENDVSVGVTERIASDIKTRLAGTSVKRGHVDEAIRSALKDAIVDVLQQERFDLEGLIESKHGPFVIMMIGFNGTGKTTTLAKLAFRFRKYDPVLAAADTFRAASIEQLEEHGKMLRMRVIKHAYGSDAAAVIFDAKKHAEANKCRLVLADTAGRAHSNVNLMDELKKVVRVNKPDLKILVLDSITGNDIYEQCRLFNEAVGVDAIILTKADVYERGGAALSASYTLKKPILFLGTGQGYTDLKEFVPESIADNLVKD